MKLQEQFPHLSVGSLWPSAAAVVEVELDGSTTVDMNSFSLANLEVKC